MKNYTLKNYSDGTYVICLEVDGYSVIEVADRDFSSARDFARSNGMMPIYCSISLSDMFSRIYHRFSRDIVRIDDELDAARKCRETHEMLTAVLKVCEDDILIETILHFQSDVAKWFDELTEVSNPS